MKALFEAVWADNKVRCPCHLVWWHGEPHGCHLWYGGLRWAEVSKDVWWSRGKKLNPLPGRRKRV